MATNSNSYGCPPPYGVQSGASFPQQQPVYNNSIPYSTYYPTQMGYPQYPMQFPMQYPQYQQQPMMTSQPNANIHIFPHDAILFYDDDKPYYQLTNFASYGFDLNGVYWPTSEHYFQAQKFVGYPQKMTQVRTLASPRDAFDFVRRSENIALIRKDWATKKDEIMYEALTAKFTHNKELLKLLLETNDRHLVEDSPHDPYWGIGKDKKGRNKLGELLMRLRMELRNSQSSYLTPSHTVAPVSSMEPKSPLRRSSSLSRLHSSHSTQYSDRICYDANDSNHFLSNCFETDFKLDDHRWPTVLHYFVAKKFNLKPSHVRTILAMRSTRDVHLYSRNSLHKQDIDSYWDAAKKSIMKEALGAKFEQNLVLKQKLLDTADTDIVELSNDDTYWSQEADGTGRNIMGILLSQIRFELKSLSITKHVHSSPTSVVSSSFTKYSSTQAALTSNLTGGLFKRMSLNIVPTSYNSALTKCSPTHSPAITNITSDLLKRRSPDSSPSAQDTGINNLSVDLSRTKLTNSIYFFDPNPLLKYNELSTFYVNKFNIDGMYWSSVQHYFQAQKYKTGISQRLMDKIRTSSSPSEAFALGTDRNNSFLMVRNWDSLREGVMLKALRAKFSDTTLKRILLDTGDRHLVHDSKEEFWGIGKDGKGKNMLGQFLMKIREELKREYSPSKRSNQSYQPADNDTIKFYEEYEPYYGFTPHSLHSVTLDGVRWRTLNHYYQAHKFTDQKYKNEIMSATTPQRASYLAKIVNNKFTKSMTLTEKQSIMEKGLAAKFAQNPTIKQSLLSTGTRHLLFVHPTDILWGTGSHMNGSNLLGNLLMNLRYKLNNTGFSQQTDHTFSSEDEDKDRRKPNSVSIINKKVFYPPNTQVAFRTKLFLLILAIVLLIISIIICTSTADQ